MAIQVNLGSRRELVTGRVLEVEIECSEEVRSDDILLKLGEAHADYTKD